MNKRITEAFSNIDDNLIEQSLSVPAEAKTPVFKKMALSAAGIVLVMSISLLAVHFLRQPPVTPNSGDVTNPSQIFSTENANPSQTQPSESSTAGTEPESATETSTTPALPFKDVGTFSSACKFEEKYAGNSQYLFFINQKQELVQIDSAGNRKKIYEKVESINGITDKYVFVTLKKNLELVLIGVGGGIEGKLVDEPLYNAYYYGPGNEIYYFTSENWGDINHTSPITLKVLNLGTGTATELYKQEKHQGDPSVGKVNPFQADFFELTNGNLMALFEFEYPSDHPYPFWIELNRSHQILKKYDGLDYNFTSIYGTTPDTGAYITARDETDNKIYLYKKNAGGKEKMSDRMISNSFRPLLVRNNIPYFLTEADTGKIDADGEPILLHTLYTLDSQQREKKLTAVELSDWEYENRPYLKECGGVIFIFRDFNNSLLGIYDTRNGKVINP